MDKDALVENAIDEGKKLIIGLDERDFKITGAFWYYDSDVNDWMLFISTLLTYTLGPTEGYDSIRAVINDLKLSKISLSDISIVGPDFWLVKILKSAINTGPGIANIKFINTVINGVLIEEAYIYRLN